MMLATDVNVLVYAHREDAAEHERYRGWFERLVDSREAFGLSELVLSGFLRVVTHPRVFKTPTPLTKALDFVGALRDNDNAVIIAPGERHWAIFTALCRQTRATGNLVADAYLAALALESGCEWISTDREYARFPGLRWRHPLDK